jgi:hypothetical protein
MPKYLDTHPTMPLPPEVLAAIKDRLESGRPDEFDEVGHFVFIGAQRTFCYTEAPDAESVRKSHAALGVHLAPEDVMEVQVLP